MDLSLEAVEQVFHNLGRQVREAFRCSRLAQHAHFPLERKWECQTRQNQVWKTKKKFIKPYFYLLWKAQECDCAIEQGNQSKSTSLVCCHPFNKWSANKSLPSQSVFVFGHKHQGTLNSSGQSAQCHSISWKCQPNKPENIWLGELGVLTGQKWWSILASLKSMSPAVPLQSVIHVTTLAEPLGLRSCSSLYKWNRKNKNLHFVRCQAISKTIIKHRLSHIPMANDCSNWISTNVV